MLSHLDRLQLSTDGPISQEAWDRARELDRQEAAKPDHRLRFAEDMLDVARGEVRREIVVYRFFARWGYTPKRWLEACDALRAETGAGEAGPDQYNARSLDDLLNTKRTRIREALAEYRARWPRVHAERVTLREVERVRTMQRAFFDPLARAAEAAE